MHPWHQSVYTQIFLLLWHTFTSLDSFSYQQSQGQTLQGIQMAAVNAQVFYCACVTTLESIRFEDEFNLFWNKVKQFAEKHKIDEPHLLRRKNIPNRCLIDKAASEHPEKVEEEY